MLNVSQQKSFHSKTCKFDLVCSTLSFSEKYIKPKKFDILERVCAEGCTAGIKILIRLKIDNNLNTKLWKHDIKALYAIRLGNIECREGEQKPCELYVLRSD